jgi:hypothetical protein|tara:strand:+ start:501 stop:677 length:177 start_codon:yes stop_codon:yes gene_type:complete
VVKVIISHLAELEEIMVVAADATVEVVVDYQICIIMELRASLDQVPEVLSLLDIHLHN